tara:strand:- start:303 stop:461 length:159 start_codon:yes stop_codon:yes gene_type:complete
MNPSNINGDISIKKRSNSILAILSKSTHHPRNKKPHKFGKLFKKKEPKEQGF